MGRVGTLEWADETGGKLATRDRVTLVLQILATQSEAIARMFAVGAAAIPSTADRPHLFSTMSKP